MTPSDKASELVYRFLNAQTNSENIAEAKQCALVCVKELVYSHLIYNQKDSINYWAKVELELEKH
jgi:hypothetical protein